MVVEFTKPGWSLFTNHGHVLVCLATDPTIRARDVAVEVGITERAVQGIISDLVEAGIVSRTREGRRNRYEVHPDQPLRHPLESEHTVGELLLALGKLPRAVRVRR
jgi:DNA-binding transcriptional ArsR family regulator